MKYPQTQKEALVWGVERFSYYLINKLFTIRTDSEANEFIFRGSHRCGKRSITRAETWALRLLPYRFEIKRIPGELNVADALSRLISKSQSNEAFDEENEKHLLFSLDAGTMTISWAEIQKTSEIDQELEEVRQCINIKQ